MNTEARGQIITFYSYKGGTGRSMALANVACVLAQQQSLARGKGVLMIDWDLEAPGLHRYFRNRLTTSRLGFEEIDRRDSHDSAPGLIDLFCELDKSINSIVDGKKKAEAAAEDAPWAATEEAAQEVVSRINLSDFVISTTIDKLSLLKAGRFNSQDPNAYSEQVNKFNWEALFKKSPHLMRVFAETLAERYAYVLIDSRTGITDISGVSTMLLPEKLVVVFTPNLQSLKGGLELIRKATDYRKQSADLRSLQVFPLVSRVETTESELRHEWRFGNLDTDGYQPEFEKVLADVYGGERIKLNKYFNQLQIPHIPRYAYGEEIAVLIEKTWDVFSLKRMYHSFADKLITAKAPWEGEIEEPTAADSDFFQASYIRNWVVDTLSLSRASRPVRMMVFLLLLTLASFAYPQFQIAQSSKHSLQQAQADNQELRKQVDELRDPIKGILAENNKRINELVQEVSNVSQQRDAKSQEAQLLQDKAAQLKTQADRAVQAQKQAQNSLALAQNDITAASNAYNDMLTKYSASQSEVRKLQAQLARCRP